MSEASPAPMLVFAHYFGGSGASWSPLLDALGGAFDCLAPSLPGFGGTAAPPTPSLEFYTDEVSAMAVGAPWIGVGHSMGGKIMLSAAARGAAGLIGLILIAPSPPTPEPMSEADRQKTISEFGDLVAARAHIEAITAQSLSPAVFERAVQDEVDVANSAWLWWMDDGSRQDISAATRGLGLPVLVLTGDNDKVLDLSVPFGVARDLTSAEVRVIEGGGHLLPMERPDVVAQAISGFVSGFVRPGPR